MELTPFTIYWIMQADIFRTVVALALAFGVILLILSLPIQFAENLPDIAKKMRRWGIPILTISTLVIIFMPTTKTLVTMYGVPAVVKIAADVKLDETAKKSVAALNRLLDEYAKTEEKK